MLPAALALSLALGEGRETQLRHSVDVPSSKERVHSMLRLRNRYDDGDHLCSAFALGPRKIATAAHCVQSWSRDKGHYHGSQVFQGGKEYRVATNGVHVHPEYRLDLYDVENVDEEHIVMADVAVLTLEDTIPGPYLSLATDTTALDNVEMRGYGSDEPNSESHPVDVLRRGSAIVEKRYGQRTRLLRLLGLAVDTVKDALNLPAGVLVSGEHGDSGGPVLNLTGEVVGILAMCDGDPTPLPFAVTSKKGQEKRELPLRFCTAIDVSDPSIRAFLQRINTLH